MAKGKKPNTFIGVPSGGGIHMSDSKKKKWTVVDTIIVIVVLAAAAAGFKMMSNKIWGGTETKITAQILIPNQNKALGDAIQGAIGEEVTLSLTEKDSGVIKDVKVEPASVMVYDSMKGEYRLQELEETVDITATVEVNVKETDYAFMAGSTAIKVGNATPFRGKGYATEGNVIVIEKEGK
ncbi:MAG: DUF4330 family protein [Oscillospiraceae bacterium]|nr:DUF4330 family protein [Oscillospiraceae bacterium]